MECVRVELCCEFFADVRSVAGKQFEDNGYPFVVFTQREAHTIHGPLFV